ncbi:uncharacterized protein [Physcomitrium patens]|uniref:PHD-type domain-containing protein n=1 Tax=Physcomitrium patens TaxID=3218 RepID=A0A7I4F5E2_PHYPA|nr:uncharacterized protein LOC112292159 isoform X2 [Physcomitrium patens]|eukprot:XP_024396123.1 uncharacterized protein LOC112292159 isoform X2 [Physcomitrella patens]
MAGEGLKKEKCELFDLPPRKRFKLLEEQRREKEMELQTRDSCCNDITNYPSHGVSPKKLALQELLMLDKENHNYKQRRVKRPLVQAMPPVPPRPVAVKRKDPPSLLMPITARSASPMMKLKSPASGAFKSWGDPPSKGSFTEIKGNLEVHQPANVSSPGSSQLFSEASEDLIRRSVCYQSDVPRKESRAAHLKTPTTWVMSKGVTCSINKAQEDADTIVCESPSPSSYTSSSEEDMTEKVVESVSMNTTSFPPMVPVGLNVLITRSEDTHQLATEIQEDSLVDEDVMAASQTAYPSTSDDMMKASTFSVPMGQGVNRRGIESETESSTEAEVKPVDAEQSVCLDATNTAALNVKTSIQLTNGDILLAKDGDKNRPSLDAGATIETTLPTMVNGLTLRIPADGYELKVKETKMEYPCKTSEENLKASTTGSIIREPDACSLTASSSIVASVKSAGTSSNPGSSEGVTVTTNQVKDNLCEKSDSDCPAKQQEEQTPQVASDASDDFNGIGVQENQERKDLRQLSISWNDEVVDTRSAEDCQVEPRSINNGVVQSQNSSFAFTVSSCKASQGDEVFPCSESPEKDSPIPPDLKTSSFRLQEQSHELVCKSSKEDNGWDWEMDVPNFTFGMRSGMTQRVKAPGRWSDRSKVEATSVDEDEDDDGACDVCRSADGTPSDPLVYCDGCNVGVHANCYGNPLHHEVPEGDWFCVQCQSRSPDSRSCCLCPRSGGAMKLTTDGNWAHLSCAIYVPEVFYRQPDDLERIDTSHVPSKRWLSTCSVCNSTGGACIDCTEIGCTLRFHVSCALRKNLAMEFRDGRNGAIVISFCEEHTAAWEEQQESKKGHSKYKIVSREPKKMKMPLKMRF